MKKIVWLAIISLFTLNYATAATKPDSSDAIAKPATSTVNVTASNCDKGTPCYVIKTSASTLSQAVNQNVSEKQAYAMIQNSIIPQIDFTLVTRLAMGNSWKTATSDQQTQIINLFKQMLVFSYSSALSKLKGAQVSIINSKIVGDKQNRATVNSTMAMPNNGDSNNQPINIEYDLAKIDSNWKIYDVKIENASIVTTYRSQFNDTVQKDGIPGLIKQLQAKVDSMAVDK